MKNPREIHYDDLIPRQTMRIVAKNTGISQVSLYKYYNDKLIPSEDKITKIANYLKISNKEVIRGINRCRELVRAGYKLPRGLIIEKHMLLGSYQRLINGEKPYLDHLVDWDTRL